MTQFKTSIITAKGHALMAKLLNNQGTAKFTKVVTSDTVYEDEQLEALTDISAIKQSVLVSNVTVTNSSTVTVEVAIENSELTQGYYLNSIGLYAQDPTAGEILYSVTTAEQNAFIPAFNSVTSTGLIIKLITSVSNSDNVSLEINPAATMTREDTVTLISEMMPVKTINGLKPNDEGGVTVTAGGINLLHNTNDFSFYWHANGATVTKETLDGESVLHIVQKNDGTSNGSIAGFYFGAPKNIFLGQDYVVSLDFKGVGSIGRMSGENGGENHFAADEWSRIFQISTCVNVGSAICVYGNSGLGDIDIYVRRVMVEHGRIPHDYQLPVVTSVGGQYPDATTGDIDTSGYAKQSKDNVFSGQNDFSVAPTVSGSPIITKIDYDALVKRVAALEGGTVNE
ncbi:phage tail-collar fiber domain-containing protein [Lacticaseibacillus sharpeae]|uniref:Phage tail fibre protein N-terminal domain-containing protein n=1 Tax=Lacticaseibacillus sharpeae JCM 1186 = DSM 20505 TaxID=1291052 RepID=A0A0R1ZI32_9LACO|nr:phage tail protein [Lacticaseibacillus sharpeae]KRM54632.1 hypothetical protein FC18_GL002343 [Lacticaseibacillus sharpeae JCM 1186 = DSM 20505]